MAAENVRVQGGGAAAAVRRKMTDSKAEEGSASSLRKEEFWMRDPKTGNWIPESHFNEIDVAELREIAFQEKATMKGIYLTTLLDRQTNNVLHD